MYETSTTTLDNPNYTSVNHQIMSVISSERSNNRTATCCWSLKTSNLRARALVGMQGLQVSAPSYLCLGTPGDLLDPLVSPTRNNDVQTSVFKGCPEKKKV
jgi:hypothetical protein